jgi:hypothetical protein
MLGKYDPAEMRKAIGVPELSESLFPTVLSGVRFWPYLLVAHELRDEKNKATVERKLRAIHRKQRHYQDKGRYAREFGPSRFSTFVAYRRLYEKIISTQSKGLPTYRSCCKHDGDIAGILNSSLITLGNGELRYERPWSPLRLFQRVGRLTRRKGKIGFNSNVRVAHVIIPGSVEEERVNRLLRRIQFLADEQLWPTSSAPEKLARALLGSGPSLHLAEAIH